MAAQPIIRVRLFIIRSVKDRFIMTRNARHFSWHVKRH